MTMDDTATGRTDLNRRDFLARMSGLPLAAGLGKQWIGAMQDQMPMLPLKEEFDIKGTFINSAYTHPMSKGARAAIERFLDERMQNGRAPGYDMSADRKICLALFSKIMNAEPGELAWIPSTMAGENHIVNALSIPGSRARVVTDAYHFEGSLYLYGELAKQGIDLEVVRPQDNGIDLEQMEKAITSGTRLVAVSSVSTVNGFAHDLKALCQLTHDRGAVVYADIIHSAGAVPLDLHDCGVDFAATATYKWLMGDFGVGLLYVRKDRLGMLHRVQHGYRQIREFESHVFPFEPPGEHVYDATPTDTTAGYFEVGTLGNSGVAGLQYSLGLLDKIGVPNIYTHRAPLIQRLQEELPGMGFKPMTRKGTVSPIVSFAYDNADKILKPKLDKAGVNIQCYPHRVRISPSFFNDMQDVETLIKALR
jgi:selenocysteine lyase/cysteine desulfurase